MQRNAHTELQSTRRHLLQIYDAISNFRPLAERPPIIDSSLDVGSMNDLAEETSNQWLQPEGVPGLKKLKECIKLDLEGLEKFLDDPNCGNLPPLSTNAPYLVAVWNELVCAPPPVVSVFKTFKANANVSTPSDKKPSRSEGKKQPPGVKVDIVADNGRKWIRVNTTKNSRLQSEFREIDSYLTDSSDSSDLEWDSTQRPSLAQSEFDNSILRMGRSLLDAARSNPLQRAVSSSQKELHPKVSLRLTRLDPNLPNDDGTPPDPRIEQTITSLREMGVEVELGERNEFEIIEKSPITSSEKSQSPSPDGPHTCMPTQSINLDLSILIALISDLTHATLPRSVEEAYKRFVPPQEYRDWKQKRLAAIKKDSNSKSKSQSSFDSKESSPDSLSSAMGAETDINDLPRDLIKHARALTNQLLQEMGRGMLQEIHEKIRGSNVVFWTTPEARDRCLRIVSKIGGIHEKRRSRALFCLAMDGSDATEISVEDAEKLYWQDSRFARNFVPLLPIRIFPAASLDDVDLSSSSIPRYPRSEFALSLSEVCKDILAQETMPHPRSRSTTTLPAHQPDDTESPLEIQRASVTKANPRLTAHTIQSMRWGAQLGWTTLTANRTSVKAILREIRSARIAGRIGNVDQKSEAGNDGEDSAAIWIVDPRSLAEGMSSLPSARGSFAGSGSL